MLRLRPLNLRSALRVWCACALVVLAPGTASAATPVEELAAQAAAGDRAALDALVDLARRGKDAAAEYALGLMALDGRGLGRNTKQAFQLVQRAAAKGHPDACNTLGYFLQRGIGVAADNAQALNWYRRGAAAGSAGAQLNLGWFLEQGIALEKDPVAAADWYRKAAGQGLAAAKANLANLYALGTGVPRDVPAAMDLYRSALAGRVESAGYHLGRLLEEQGDIPAATEHYLAAARGRVAEAEFPAGRLLVATGNPRRNMNQGVYWLDRAASRDNLEALMMLANLYYAGAGLQKEPSLAAGYFRRAALLGDPLSAFRYADYLESEMLTRPGTGAGDREEVLGWYRRAADKGYAEAQFRLARALQAQPGPAREEGVGWYRKAAAQGHFGAALQLALALDNGAGVPASPAESIPWYLKAAGAGSAEACFRLALLYDRGRGTPTDFVRARDYYSRAAALGHAEAEQVLRRLVGIPVLEEPRSDPFKGMR